MTGAVWIGVDVGGTKVLAAEVDADGGTRRVRRCATPPSAAGIGPLETTITDVVAEVADGRPIAGVGVSAAGLIDAAGERVMFAPHLAWHGDPVRDRLAAAVGAPVLLDNDATCAAYAEWRFGAARDSEHLLLLTLGTGIGGGLVLGGRLHRGQHGMAGEIGHLIAVVDGLPCPCGGRGCWEQYVSGTALVRVVRARLDRAGPGPSAACGGDPAALTGPMVTAAARAGDPVCLEALHELGEWLGIGLVGLVGALDPERIVIGGGLAAAGDLLLEPARAVLGRSLIGAGQRAVPPILPAALGAEAGLIGAAALASR